MHKVERPAQPKSLCLHNLPVEILLAIFDLYASDIKTLLRLALTCHKFNIIIDKHYLYKDVVVSSVSSFSKFAVCHLPLFTSSLSKKLKLNEPSTKINYIQTFHLINPPTKDSINHNFKVAGSYNVENVHNRDVLNYQEYIECFLTLLHESYGIKTITISEISPSSSFSTELITSSSTASSSLQFWKKEKPRKSLDKLVLKTQSGWSIPFKLSHISLFISHFANFNHLVLHNFIIDDYKLTVSFPTLTKTISIKKLSLNSCIFANTLRKLNCDKKMCQLFSDVSSLELNNILSVNDLSVIDFIKQNHKLSQLIIDFSSPVFYNNEKKFNFARYNSFFKLVASGTGGYSTLKDMVLTKFDLFQYFDHKHKPASKPPTNNDPNIDPSETETFEYLLTYLGQIKNLTIVLTKRIKRFQTCKNCGFTESSDNDKDMSLLTVLEWSIILRPLLSANENCKIRIKDHNYTTLFTR